MKDRAFSALTHRAIVALKAMNFPDDATLLQLSMNLTAFDQGLCARQKDDDLGGLADNPYLDGTDAFNQWYIGYNWTDTRCHLCYDELVDGVCPKCAKP